MSRSGVFRRLPADFRLAADVLCEESRERYADLAATQTVAVSDYAFDDAGRITDLTHTQRGRRHLTRICNSKG